MARRYTDADLAAILVKQGMPVDFPYTKNRKPRDPNMLTESQIQQRLIKWWRGVAAENSVPENLMMAFPLQGHRTAMNGARMKAEGMRKGTLDMFVAIPRNGYHGCWVELKTEKGKLSPEQKTMISNLKNQGYMAGGAYGLADAQRFILAYLRGEEFF